mgnify:CR=1 FL=1
MSTSAFEPEASINIALLRNPEDDLKKPGQLFEEALGKSGIPLESDTELLVRVKKTGSKLEMKIERLRPQEPKARSRKLHSVVKAPSAVYRTNSSLGERIRSLRVGADLSLRSLADKAEISKGSLGSLERDERPVGLTVLRRISKALEIDLSILVDS